MVRHPVGWEYENAVAVAVRTKAIPCLSDLSDRSGTHPRWIVWFLPREHMEDRDQHLSRRCDNCDLVILPLFQPCVEVPEILVTPDSYAGTLDKGPAQRR